MRYGSLCSGGMGLDLGMEEVGMIPAWFVEPNAACREIITRAHPGVEVFEDIRSFVNDSYPRVDVVCAGDPCPKHSRARSNGKSKHPDLSGYVLAVVGRLRPRWVVRENVPASTVAWFTCALERLGYGVVVIRMDASTYTGQRRIRDFVVGRYQTPRDSFAPFFGEPSDDKGYYSPRLGTGPYVPCLTTHRTRYDSRDCYIWEPGRQVLRTLDGDERDSFAGFPAGWTAGFSESARARITGNAVVRHCVREIGNSIVRYEEEHRNVF